MSIFFNKKIGQESNVFKLKVSKSYTLWIQYDAKKFSMLIMKAASLLII